MVCFGTRMPESRACQAVTGRPVEAGTRSSHDLSSKPDVTSRHRPKLKWNTRPGQFAHPGAHNTRHTGARFSQGKGDVTRGSRHRELAENAGIRLSQDAVPRAERSRRRRLDQCVTPVVRRHRSDGLDLRREDGERRTGELSRRDCRPLVRSALLEAPPDRLDVLVEEGLLTPLGAGEERRFRRSEVLAVRDLGA
jgi:hypothetical protein